MCYIYLVIAEHALKNAGKEFLFGAVLLLQLIPARGRKHFHLFAVYNVNDCNLSPQGDDNIGFAGTDPDNKIAAYPRKGTITTGSRCRSNRPELQLIPARGQKTPHQKMRSFSFTKLNSLVSVGCPSMNGTIAAAVIFSLLRLLHSDKMCYNKANSKHLLQN